MVTGLGERTMPSKVKLLRMTRGDASLEDDEWVIGLWRVLKIAIIHCSCQWTMHGLQ